MALSWPVDTDDDGTGTTGTIHNNAWLQTLAAAINGWPLDTYTPAWTGSGSNPALGNGTVSGKYIELGDLVIGGFHFTMGSTTTYGTSNYSMSIPVTASTTWPGLCLVWAVDSSGGNALYSGFGTVFTTTTLLLTNKADPAVAWNTTTPIPFAFAQSDILKGIFVYLRA
jgi:hypothetical protein